MADTPYPLPRETRESTIDVGDSTAGPFGPSQYRVFDIVDVQVFARTVGEPFFQNITDTVAVTKTTGAAYDTFSVTFANPIGANTEWFHSARRVAERSVAVTRGGTMDSDQTEKELSKIATTLSELRRDLGRTLQVEPGQPQPMVQPLSDGHFSKWKDGRLVDGGSADDVANAQGYAETAGEQASLAHEWAEATIAAGIFNIVVADIVGDGVTSRFPLGVAPASVNNVFLTSTGLVQHVGEYTVDGTDLVFAIAPPVGYGGQARVLAITRAVPYVADGTVTPASFSPDAMELIGSVADGTVTPASFSPEALEFIGGVRGNILPAIEGATTAGTATYPTSRGQYRHVNDWVDFSAETSWTGATGTGDTYIRLHGAPVSAYINTPVAIQAAGFTYGADVELQGVLLAGTNVVMIQTRASGASGLPVPVDASGTLRIFGGYPAASDGLSDILFMGDSVTYGVRPGVGETDTFRYKVQNALGWAMAHNAGVPSENASEQEARMAAALTASGAQAVCIMTGINDYFDPLPYATMGTKITSMINMAQAAGAKVTLCSNTPTQDAGMIANFGPWLNTIQACGALTGVVYVPVYEHFMALRSTLPPDQYAALFVDTQHIGPTGHDVVTALITATAGACRP